ncbi:hypothetical protein QCD60_15650 [Pokkaliibacter sp. MBI-7]|uniref:hypothetical protein n=1 Tax=Pokkaliibacter sp. MBI-7 TaxID=3040600 RepID=UPI00244C42A2|nr:hypothetical protein [Pokkaliibacter sp. MBI-7]MDH2434001.1 hypothetical protein [Pokkaliibacter sp. MBI-7]
MKNITIEDIEKSEFYMGVILSEDVKEIVFLHSGGYAEKNSFIANGNLYFIN